MKLHELQETQQTKKSKGTYAGGRFSKDTKDAISKYIKDNDIPNPIDINTLHVTILFSRKPLLKYKACGNYETPLIGTPTKFEKWETGSKKKALILTFDCKQLTQRHEKLMDEHEAEWDWDDYIPHTTLSYDVGDDFDVSKLPKFKNKLEITKEYQEELDLDGKTE